MKILIHHWPQIDAPGYDSVFCGSYNAGSFPIPGIGIFMTNNVQDGYRQFVGSTYFHIPDEPQYKDWTYGGSFDRTSQSGIYLGSDGGVWDRICSPQCHIAYIKAHIIYFGGGAEYDGVPGNYGAWLNINSSRGIFFQYIDQLSSDAHVYKSSLTDIKVVSIGSTLTGTPYTYKSTKTTHCLRQSQRAEEARNQIEN